MQATDYVIAAQDAPAVGDAATLHVGTDSYPAVVVAATAKTVYIATVRGIATGDSSAGGVETVLDPESVDAAMAAGKDGAKAFRVRAFPSRIRNGREEQEHGLPVGSPVTRERWFAVGDSKRRPSYGVSFGTAQTKTDPHL